jgi:hypothetical protein
MIRALAFAFMFFVGYQFGMYAHPYEECKREGFVGPAEIVECIWLLTEEPGLG